MKILQDPIDIAVFDEEMETYDSCWLGFSTFSYDNCQDATRSYTGTTCRLGHNS